MFHGADHNPVERFCGLAEIYGRNRPGYPDAALRFILGDLISDARIADIGSGTGILTRAFALRGWDVIGIEPNAQMREEACQTPCNALRRPAYSNGSAEVTGLADSSVDLVVAGQAFHWFDADIALAEFHRVLRPGGVVALIWNHADQSDVLTRGYWQTLRELSTDPEVVREAHHFSGRILLVHCLFTAEEQAIFANLQPVDEEGLIGRACSASFAPRNGPDLEELICRLRALFARHQYAGEVVLRYETIVYRANRASN